jgi:hypothetical protein
MCYAVYYDFRENRSENQRPAKARARGVTDGQQRLRIRRLGVRIPPSALRKFLVVGLPGARVGARGGRHPYKNPYSCRDDHHL